MSIQGVRVDRAGRTWEVGACVREGPSWRLTFKAVDDPRCRLHAYIESTRRPLASELPQAVSNAHYRWFVDRSERVWRTEVSPRYELGEVVGNWLTFTLDGGMDRHKYPYDGREPLIALPDIKLLEYLLRAIKGL